MKDLSLNLSRRLTAQAQARPQQDAIVQARGLGFRRLSFGDLEMRVAMLAGGLRERGLGHGDRALIAVPMSIELYELILALWRLGAVPVFLDAWADRRRVAAAVKLAAPKAFFAGWKGRLLGLTLSGLRALPLKATVGSGAPWRLDRLHGPRSEVQAVEESETALVTFTTGSTGNPKGVLRSHGLLWNQHLALKQSLRLEAGSVDMPTLPIFVLNNLALGVTSVIPDFDPARPAKIDRRRILNQMKEAGVATSSGSPAFYEALTAGEEMVALEKVFTGGAPVLPSAAAGMASKLKGSLFVVYGSTEAEPIAMIDAPSFQAAAGENQDGNCAGLPESVDIRILRPMDGPVGAEQWEAGLLPNGEIGEIVVAGGHVVEAYLNNPEAMAMNKIHAEGRIWHRTGDGGWLDAQGRLWLAGRVNRRLEREGRQWWPQGVENRVRALDGVAMASWFPLKSGSQSSAVLCYEGSATIEEAALRQAAAPWPVDRILRLKRLPRDPRHASKIDTDRLIKLVNET